MDLLRTRPAVPEWSPSSASLHPKPISDSPHRMSWSEQAESCSAQLTTAPPPPSPPLFHPSILSTLPLLCAQPRDLICLVISGLACSAQLHSKVKLDKGIGASPCKTASPWQLLEWAADCRRVEEEGREVCRWEKDVPERKAETNSLLSFPQGRFVSRKGASYKDGSCSKWRQSTRCYWGPTLYTTACWSLSSMSSQLPVRPWQIDRSTSICDRFLISIWSGPNLCI